MLFYVSIEHSLLCSFVILLFYYDVLSFCFNILIDLLRDLMCSYAIMLCNFVVLSSVVLFFGPNVKLYDSVLLLCYVVVLSFCFNALLFCYSTPSFCNSGHSLIILFQFFIFLYHLACFFCHSMVLSCFSASLFYPSASQFANDICMRPLLNTQKVRTSYQTHQTFSLMHLHLGIGI